jgi:hypothetical protein
MYMCAMGIDFDPVPFYLKLQNLKFWHRNTLYQQTYLLTFSFQILKPNNFIQTMKSYIWKLKIFHSIKTNCPLNQVNISNKTNFYL